MKSLGTLKHFVIALFIALVIYVGFFYGIENRRTRQGPWQVIFTNETTIPTLIINQPALHITNLKLSFPTQTTPATNLTARFDQPEPVPFEVPFGQVIFEDTTFQPGTIVFEMYGHEIQLLPRILTIDKVERPWQSNTNISVK